MKGLKITNCWTCPFSKSLSKQDTKSHLSVSCSQLSGNFKSYSEMWEKCKLIEKKKNKYFFIKSCENCSFFERDEKGFHCLISRFSFHDIETLFEFCPFPEISKKEIDDIL